MVPLIKSSGNNLDRTGKGINFPWRALSTLLTILGKEISPLLPLPPPLHVIVMEDDVIRHSGGDLLYYNFVLLVPPAVRETVLMMVVALPGQSKGCATLHLALVQPQHLRDSYCNFFFLYTANVRIRFVVLQYLNVRTFFFFFFGS